MSLPTYLSPCLNTASDFIWTRWKSSEPLFQGEYWHRPKLSCSLTSYSSHTNFCEREMLSGSCSGFLASIFLSRQCILGGQDFPRCGSISLAPRGEMVARPWEKPLGIEGNNGVKHPGRIFQMKV